MATEVLERLRDAQNRHDLDTFVGSQQVRENWAEVFAGVPDFHAELLRSAHEDDTGWAEWRWRGTRVDGAGSQVGHTAASKQGA